MDDDLLDEPKEAELDPDAVEDVLGANLDDDLGEDEVPKVEEEESLWGDN